MGSVLQYCPTAYYWTDLTQNMHCFVALRSRTTAHIPKAITWTQYCSIAFTPNCVYSSALCSRITACTTICLIAQISCLIAYITLNLEQDKYCVTEHMNSVTTRFCTAYCCDLTTGCPAKHVPLLFFEFLGFLLVQKFHLGHFSTGLSVLI